MKDGNIGPTKRIKAKQSKAKQSKAKQSKAKQSKAKQRARQKVYVSTFWKSDTSDFENAHTPSFIL